MNKVWEDGEPRSSGGPFDVLYTTRPEYVPKPKKITKRRTSVEKSVSALRDKRADPFNVPIMTRAESDRTQAIRSRGLM